MIKKGSQFTRIFRQEVRRLATTGILDLLRKRYTGSLSCKPLLQEKPLGYEKLSFLFVMLIFGCIVSIFVVFFEYTTQTKKKEKELVYKVKEMSLMEEKMGDFLEGLSNEETQTFFGRLFLKHFKKETEDTKLDIIPSNDFIFSIGLDPKNCSCKIPRFMTKRNSI